MKDITSITVGYIFYMVVVGGMYLAGLVDDPIYIVMMRITTILFILAAIAIELGNAIDDKLGTHSTFNNILHIIFILVVGVGIACAVIDGILLDVIFYGIE